VRKILVGAVVVLAVLVAAAFIGPQFIPAESIKQDISAEVEKATGRQLAIDGSLNFRVLPSPGVTASGVRLSNAQGGSVADMVRLRTAIVEVALFPLLSANVQVSRIVLWEPEIVLETFADGSNNWTFAPASGAEAASDSGTGDDKEPSAAPSVRLDDVVIREGTLTYRTPDGDQRIEKLNMTLGAESLQGPFRGNGSLIAQGFPVNLDVAIGAFVEEKATPVNVKVSAGGAALSYSGVLSGAPEATRMSGQVALKAADLSATIADVSGAAAPGALRGKPLELEGKLDANGEAISLNDLAVRIGDDSATGAVQVALGETPRIDIVLNLAQLDLDRLLAGPAAGKGATGGAAAGSPSSGAAAPREPGAGGGGFALPEGIAASLETKVDAVIYRDGVIRQVRLNAQLDAGTVNISQATAQLPGGGNASLIGFVAASDGNPTFEGQAEMSADDFRAFLQWAGVDVGTVPQDRLRKMSGSLALKASPTDVTLTDIDVSVDVSRLRGGVAIALRERPGFGIGLSLDKVNVDAYLPAPAPAAATPGAGAAGAGSDAPTPQAAPAGGNGLAVLDTFDSIVQLKVGEVVFRDQTVRGISVDGTLQGGALELRDVSAQSLAGARAAVRGRLDGLATSPSADVRVDIDAPDADRLLALAGVSAPSKIGAGKLSGTFRGDLQNLDIDAGVDAIGAKLLAKGKVAVLASPPRYNLNLDLTHPDAGAFVARLQGVPPSGVGGTGRLAAHVGASGDLDRANLDVGIDIGEGRISAVGKLAGLAAGGPTGALALEAGHPDMVAFVRTFAPDYRPALAKPGPFKLTSRLTLQPQAMEFAGLEGQAGPVNFKGSARVATGGVRPDVTAQLETSEIVVDWFLPARESGSRAGTSGAGSTPGTAAAPRSASAPERWSREPLDLSALAAADADIKLSAPAIAYTNIRVDQPRLAMRLKDGVFDLTDLSGNAFGGAFGMTGQLAARDVPTMRYTMKVEGADAAKFLENGGAGDRGVMSALELLFPVSSVKLVSGKLGADLDVASSGRSEFAMISNLGGKGAVRFTDAVVDGIDVCRISNQLDRLNGIEGFLGLALSAKGGQTKVANFDGRFDIANGVATLPRQAISADCATVDFSGNTNLPSWLVDIQARAAFLAHTDFPGVVVEQKGSLDAPNTRLVNVNEINQYIVGKAAGSVLQKLLPGAGQQQQQPSSPSGETQPQQPADQFRNLLEGLIKRR
jgi:uncharacterized protein involved in outer membrane biogenesis